MEDFGGSEVVHLDGVDGDWAEGGEDRGVAGLEVAEVSGGFVGFAGVASAAYSAEGFRD